MKVLNVVGARPNFMKIAPLIDAMRRRDISQVLVHTGQHYDEKMSQLFFRDLAIPEPTINLGVGSESHARQTAEIMRRFEPVLESEQPDLLVVVGDVNSTIACSLVAAKMGIPIAHVEAGLRSFDRSMPEEINRIVTDTLSSLLFVTEPSGVENLKREGIATDKIHFVGNVMVDTLLRFREQALRGATLQKLNLQGNGSVPRYAVVTLHRPSNVDNAAQLRSLLEVLDELATELPVVFPMHPRTRANIAAKGLEGLLRQLRVTEPMGYVEFLEVVSQSALVITDSGGIQEETTVLGIPCLTARENTERPITIERGTNQLVGRDPQRLLACARDVLHSGVKQRALPDLWDGCAAQRIVEVIASGATKDCEHA